MASHQLAIAKASFSAGLLRPDPKSVSRENIEQFHSLLNATVAQCTPNNVQKCKHWILQNILQSTARFTSLGKYLTALATSFTTSAEGKQRREPSVKRKRLHLLYLVNDILHHAKYHINDASIYGKVQQILVGLVGSAASVNGCPKHQRKILDLLDIWEGKDYYSGNYINKLREAVKNAAEGGDSVGGIGTNGAKDSGSTVKSSKSAPYVMPATHGDASTPWFDLPAANLMPHIIPNSTRPINPDMIKPLQFVAGPADESLVVAVKALLDDVGAIFGEANQDGKASWDIDELGQPIMLDEITGDVIDGEGYYGWSRSFCEKMNRRRKGLGLPGQGNERGRLSRSRSSSPTARKRRYSDSDDGSSQDGYRSRRRRRSYSSSRSPTPDRTRNGSQRQSRSRSHSRSSRDSRTPPRRSEPYPRETLLPANLRDGLPFKSPIPPNPPPSLPFQQGFNPNFPPPPPIHNLPFNGQQGFNPNFPPPPPPPIHNIPFNGRQGYNGQGFNGQGPPFGAWPPPPPGNPPIHFRQQQNQQQVQGGYPPPGPGTWQPQGDGRGYNKNGWSNEPPNKGRGNFRGRGRGW